MKGPRGNGEWGAVLNLCNSLIISDRRRRRKTEPNDLYRGSSAKEDEVEGVNANFG